MEGRIDAYKFDTHKWYFKPVFTMDRRQIPLNVRLGAQWAEKSEKIQL